jgi:asparagine synthase (glutamine-hydrolysing)
MCGIAGYFALQGRIPDVKGHVLSSLQARGPDGQGYFEDHQVALMHTRLGIIAPGAEGQQPFCSEDQRYRLIFNGEILNYAELKQTLWEAGALFQTQSDTEVLLVGLIREGVAFLNKIRGFFALAWYDSLLQRLILARDHAGIKPLCWAEDAKGIYFASHSQAILSMGFQAKPDLISLSAYLEFHFIPPERSMWEGLQPLSPGGYRIFSPEGCISGTWRKPVETFDQPARSPGEIFFSGFKRAIQRNVVADVPFGILLSGGLDSSLIAAGVKHFTDESPAVFTLKQPRTFLDESEQARTLATRFGWRSFIVELEEGDAVSWLDQMPEPVGDPAGIGVFRLTQAAAQEVKLVLSGDGADELFNGYARYKAWKKVRGLQIPAFPLPVVGSRESGFSNSLRKGGRLMRLLMRPETERYRFLSGFRPVREIRRILVANEPYLFPTDFPLPVSFNSKQIQTADLAFILPGNMLPKSDLASMQNGVELRVPYLDEEVVRMVMHFPDTYTSGKGLLKRSWKLLEGQDFRAGKKGFDISLSSLFQEKLKKRWKDLTDPQLLKEQGLFSEKFPALGSKEMSLEQAWAWMAWQSVWLRSNS